MCDENKEIILVLDGNVAVKEMIKKMVDSEVTVITLIILNYFIIIPYTN